jgi:hypothetical protein
MVLQCCDQRSVCSAARAHSRLRTAAAAALHSITVYLRHPVHKQVDSVTQYVSEHRQVDSIHLKGDEDHPPTIKVRQLPPNAQLSSLLLSNLKVQLQPGEGFHGVLGVPAQVSGLTKLQLQQCAMLDDAGPPWVLGAGRAGVLAAALLQPAGLVHLSISDLHGDLRPWQLSAAVSQKLQQLTYLELARIRVGGLDNLLQALTRLVDLRLAEVTADGGKASITASMLSDTGHLTCLMLSRCDIEPGVLDGETQLQRLHLTNCSLVGGVSSTPAAAHVAQLLSHLRAMQQLQQLQLTHMNLAQSVRGSDTSAALSVLTASSVLQCLDIRWCTLPAGVWQHMFPAGRLHPHLQSLNISDVRGRCYSYMQPPEGSILDSCCPGLQSLDITGLQYSAELLALLQGLSGLHTLSLTVDERTAGERVPAVCQLTGLRRLTVSLPRFADVQEAPQLRQLTQLQQLTALTFDGPWAVRWCQDKVRLTRKVG